MSTVTYEAGAAAVACVRFDASVVVLGNVFRCGEMARAAGEEENGCTWTGLVLEKERMASFEGRKGITLAAIMEAVCLLVIGKAIPRPKEGSEVSENDSRLRKVREMSSPMIGAIQPLS